MHAPQDVVVWAQNPLTFPPESEPRPDLALLRPRSDDYLKSLPTATDVLVVIEVSDTALAYDRDVKIPLYAKQRISECWLLDVNARRLEMYRDPGDDGYRTLLRPDRGSSVSPLALSTAAIDLEALFAGID